MSQVPTQDGHATPLRGLVLGALGVVFGDIGTSPLYAFKEAFGSAHGMPVESSKVFAVLSLIFWAVTLIVSVKYVTFTLRFDNRGEGGILALLAFSGRLLAHQRKLQWIAGVIAIMGASLFFGDAIITPAISVLSAVEGLSVATPAFERLVVPITIGVIIGLFAIQRHGTGGIGKLFGPITILWFLTLAAMGSYSIVQTPEVLQAIDPRYAIDFAAAHPGLTFIVLGSVFLALTGGEALYADMGHFGPLPIRIGWFGLVFPALMINYFGQGALVLRDPAAAKNPFYFLAPQDWLLPLVALATAATVIASQATISGAFSVAQQASRLGYFPRMLVQYTSDTEKGQIYIPRVNLILMVLVLALVMEFRSSSALAAAYGIAVSTTMVLETTLILIVALFLGKRSAWLLMAALVGIGMVELLFLASNAVKIPEGGWFPLAVALVLFTLLTTWRRGSEVIHYREARKRVPLSEFSRLLGPDVPRVPGTAIFLSAERDSIPSTLLHNLKHNRVVHQRVIVLRVQDEEVPRVPDDERTEVAVLEPGAWYQATLRYGFREEPDIMEGLRLLGRHGLRFDMTQTTFFVGRSSIAMPKTRTLFSWRRGLFRWMQKNSLTAAEYFRLPPDRVVEIGTQVSL